MCDECNSVNMLSDLQDGETVRRYYSRMHRGSQGVLVVRESLVVGESAVLSAVYVE